jgi:hypothetical protein
LILFTDAYNISIATFSAWTDIDLSEYIPENASGVIVRVINSAGGLSSFGLRKKGSSDDITDSIANFSQTTISIGCSTDRKIQANIGSADVTLWLQGYYQTEEAVFYTNAYDKSIATDTAWTDVICASCPSGVKFALLEVTGSYANGCNFRNKGSSDDRIPNNFCGHAGVIVGLDSNKTFQAYAESASGLKIRLVGYLKTGYTLENGIDVSLSGTGSYSYIPLSSVPSGAIGAIVEVFGNYYSGYNSFGIRKTGASEDLYKHHYGYSGTHAVSVQGGGFEGKIASTDVDFFILGYFTNDLPANDATGEIYLPVLKGVAGWWNTPALAVLPSITAIGEGSRLSNDGYIDLPQFTATGTDPNNATASGLLPSLSCSGELASVINAIADITLLRISSAGLSATGKDSTASLVFPRISAIGYDAPKAYLILPTLQVSANVIIGTDATASLGLRSLILSDGQSLIGTVATSGIEFNELEIYATANQGTTDIVLDKLAITATGIHGNISNSSLNLLPITCTGLSAQYAVSSADITFPKLRASGINYHGSISSASVEMKPIAVYGYGLRGNVASSDVELLTITAEAYSYEECEGVSDILLQPFGCTGFAIVQGNVVKTFCMNLKNRALTTFEGYGFNSYVKFNGQYLASGNAGIAVLSGVLDEGKKITASMQLGKISLKSEKIKRLPQVQLNLREPGDYSLSLTTEESNLFKYDVPMSENNNVFIKCAKGVKSRAWIISLSNKYGATMDIDSIDASFDVLSRKR